MANILLLANLNCDRMLQLDSMLNVGGRCQYQDGGQRLGGGGANTGLGLVWAGHSVALVSQVGRDSLGDWLIDSATSLGLDCRFIQRREGDTGEMLLMRTPDGERTIMRPQQALLPLPMPPRWQQWEAVYLNTLAEGAQSWAQTALPHCLVVAQFAKDERLRPCHILLASKSDLPQRHTASNYAAVMWAYGVTIAGASLQYFVVTDGVNGATLYSPQRVQQVAAISSKVLDTTGAGDAYAAGLIHCLCQGQSIIQAMTEGAIWGSLAVAANSSVPDSNLKQYLHAQALA